MHKGANVQACYEFGNYSMKICFKHKTKMKVNHKPIVKSCLPTLQQAIFLIPWHRFPWGIGKSEIIAQGPGSSQNIIGF